MQNVVVTAENKAEKDNDGKQDWFLDIAVKLGYKPDKRGDCLGFSHVAKNSILAGGLDALDERIKFLSGLTKPINLDENSLRKYEILPFIYAVMLYHDSHKYPEYFADRPIVRAKAVDLVTSLVMPLALEQKEKGGDKKIKQFSRSYSQKRLSSHFKSLQQKLASNPDIKSPMALIIHSTVHSITVGYEPDTKRWSLVDIEAPPIKYYNSYSDIAKAVYASLTKENKRAILAMHLHVTNKAAPAIEKCLTDWHKKHPKINTPLAREKDGYGNNWLYLAAREGDLRTVKKLFVNYRNGTNVGMDLAYFPLMGAICAHQNEVAKYLIGEGTSLIPSIPCSKADGLTALDVALYSKNVIIFDYLLQGLTRPKNHYTRFSNIYTRALSTAAYLGDSEAYAKLLPLVKETLSNHMRHLPLPGELNAPVYACLVSHAIKFGDAKIFAELLALDAKYNHDSVNYNVTISSRFNWSFLFSSLANKAHEKARLEFFEKNNLLEQAIGSFTPLYVAVLNRQEAMVEALLKTGANPQGSKDQKVKLMDIPTSSKITKLLKAFSKPAITKHGKTVTTFKPVKQSTKQTTELNKNLKKSFG